MPGRSVLVVIAVLAHSGESLGQSVAELKNARADARAAVAAYRAHDWQEYDARLRAALRVQPHHPVWLYNLASAAALQGDPARSLALLDTLATLGFALDPGGDDDFSTLRDLPAFRQRVARLAANREPTGAGTSFAALPGADFLAEGVAWDARDSVLLVSSVHERRIVRIRDGVVTTVADSSSGLWSVLGITFEGEGEATGSVWAVTTVMPEMAGYAAGRSGSALVEIDARTGAVKRRIAPAGDGHSFNDLVVGSGSGSGSGPAVYVSDTGTGAVWRWSEREGLRELVPPGAIYSPSGLALMPGTDWLYVADYPVGLVRVSTRTGEVQRVVTAAGVNTYGIDGLARHGRDLIAIQNAVPPHRVARLQLSSDGSRVERVTVLERGRPYFGEPTLGVVANDTFWYVANSGWSHFRDGRYVGPADARGPVIVKLPLNGD